MKSFHIKLIFSIQHWLSHSLLLKDALILLLIIKIRLEWEPARVSFSALMRFSETIATGIRVVNDPVYVEAFSNSARTKTPSN